MFFTREIVKMKKTIPLFIGLLFSSLLNGQSITGALPIFANQMIQLKGFNGFQDYTIDSISIDSIGNFSLNYTAADYGMGYLLSSDEKPFIIVLNGEDIVLKGEALSYTETIKITEGQQNQWFRQYTQDYVKREQTLSAWNYLEKLYTSDSLFITKRSVLKNIRKEKKRINNEEAAYLDKLPVNSYLKWFLPLRKLVNSVSVVVQYRQKEIPATRNALRQFNYADSRLYKSGLLKESLENHLWFLENSSGSIDAVFAELNTSIDVILSQSIENESVYNEITTYLLFLLEKQSLFTSAEYLAQKVLNETRCNITENVAKQMEAYRKMALGAIAPEIFFTPFTYFPAGVNAKKLSDLQADYFVVVFSAGWCSHCTQEMQELATFYPSWKEKNVEIIMVSLDENTKDFIQFAAPLPFISTTDYKKWDGIAATDYFVNSTPTYFLLNKKREIVLRPKDTKQINAWIHWVLKIE